MLISILWGEVPNHTAISALAWSIVRPCSVYCASTFPRPGLSTVYSYSCACDEIAKESNANSLKGYLPSIDKTSSPLRYLIGFCQLPQNSGTLVSAYSEKCTIILWLDFRSNESFHALYPSLDGPILFIRPIKNPSHDFAHDVAHHFRYHF